MEKVASAPISIMFLIKIFDSRLTYPILLVQFLEVLTFKRRILTNTIKLNQNINKIKSFLRLENLI